MEFLDLYCEMFTSKQCWPSGLVVPHIRRQQSLGLVLRMLMAYQAPIICV